MSLAPSLELKLFNDSRRICYCKLGFPEALRSERARVEFLDEISELQGFLRNPWTVRNGWGDAATVRIPVLRLVAPQPMAASVVQEDEGEDPAIHITWLQRRAMEDYARRLEANSDMLGEAGPLATEDQGSSAVKVICRICFSGGKEGSTKALKMLLCKMCDKKYHNSCLKNWAKNRDLFHWNSWACPSCRTCEVCRGVGDPNKLMFCRRCDGAYHCYCQQPPHKNVGHGPYVCPKHTRCHSCGSTVPGSGPSTRWFLGYTCCDACGRLFVKGNYCTVCLKVYRDSETTPMVCCDVCERWVHCACDGISDEKYQQFQMDQNLQYQCAACRGDCYQVKDIDDAVQELWRRKDEADHELMASLRARAALPSQEELSSVTPDLDNDQCGSVVLKNDHVKSLKFSVKSSKECRKCTSNNVSPNKKFTDKKAFHIKFVTRPEGSCKNPENQKEERSSDSSFRDRNLNDIISHKNVAQESLLSSASRISENGSKSSVYQSGRNTYNSTKEVGDNIVGQLSSVKFEDNKVKNLHFKECDAKTASKNEAVKGTKLVIHLGSRSRNISRSPRSETSSCHKEQDLAASYGSDHASQPKARHHENHIHETLGIIKADGKGTTAPIAVQNVGDATPMNSREVFIPKKRRQFIGPSINTQNDIGHETSRLQVVSGTSLNDSKPLLKLKFKNLCFEQSSPWVPRGEEESAIKGQRSKRKRSSAKEKPNAAIKEDDSSAAPANHQENPFTDEVMDANWILQKLGKDAVGKRVEVYQSSEKSWYKGVVSNVTVQKGGGASSSSLLVHLDDGRSTTLELGKQAVSFISSKQGKRSRM